MTSIPVEDHTRPLTNEELTERFEILSEENRKALMALSNNDQIIIAQVKEALEEATSKILYLSARLELFADLMEEVLVKKETDSEESVKKLSLAEYREIVEKIKR